MRCNKTLANHALIANGDSSQYGTLNYHRYSSWYADLLMKKNYDDSNSNDNNNDDDNDNDNYNYRNNNDNCDNN